MSSEIRYAEMALKGLVVLGLMVALFGLAKVQLFNLNGKSFKISLKNSARVQPKWQFTSRCNNPASRS